MQITIVNGSPRSRGVTGRVLQVVGEYLATKNDMHIHYIDLAKQSFEFCRGCQQCYRDARCSIREDGLETVLEQIQKSDGLILASPTNGSNVSALMKNFLDRGHFTVEQALHGKYGMSVSTYEIADGCQVNRILNKFLLVSGAIRTESVCIKAEFNSDPMIRGDSRQQLEKKVERFYSAIQKQQRKSWFEQVFTDFFLIHVIWKPFVLKHKRRYAGVIRSWEQKHLISERASK